MLALSSEPSPTRSDDSDSDERGRPAWSWLVRWLGPGAARAAIAAAVVLAGVAFASLGLIERGRSWVHGQPVYTWTPEAITLEPPPPSWFHPGGEGLIARARPALERFEGGSALDLDLEAVRRAFEQLPWVAAVERVRRSYPNRIAVELVYRRPVGQPRFPGSSASGGSNTPTSWKEASFFVDDQGVILPRDAAIDDAKLPRLIQLYGLEPPADTTPGAVWTTKPADDPDSPAQVDPQAREACRLAGFLRDRSEVEGWPEFRGEPFRIDGLWVGDDALFLIHLTAENRQINLLWGSFQIPRPPREPPDARKWALLKDWVGFGGPDQPVSGRGFWAIEEDRIVWRTRRGPQGSSGE